MAAGAALQSPRRQVTVVLVPFLTYLDPASVDPTDLVDREPVVEWLRASLDSFLRAPDKSRGRAVAILGDRGIGKSIVMQKVVDELREVHAATTLFIVVDCRGVGEQRRVYHEIARQAVDQLGMRANVDAAMLDTARLLETIAKFDDVERRVLAEHVAHYDAALQLSGTRNLLRLLGVGYDIKLGRSKKIREALDGAVRFDGTRLRDAVRALFDDLRAHAGLDAIIVLDNLDELRHEAIVDDELRTWLHGEIDGLLHLARAPIGFVVTARTYFAGSLSRQIDGNKVVRRLDDREHVAIVRRRLARETEQVQAAFVGEACDGCVERLARLAHTPLALLSWFRYLAENELHAAEDPGRELEGFLLDRFANVSIEVIKAVAAVFGEDPYQGVPQARLLAVCGNHQSVFKQLLRSQIVLPVDFWDPYEFTLAPELHFLVEGS